MRLDLHPRSSLKSHHLDLLIRAQASRWKSDRNLDRLLTRRGAIGNGLKILCDKTQRTQRTNAAHEPCRTHQDAHHDQYDDDPPDKAGNATARTVELVHPGDKWP